MVWVCVVINVKQKSGAHLIVWQAVLGQRGYCIQGLASAVFVPDQICSEKPQGGDRKHIFKLMHAAFPPGESGTVCNSDLQ